MVYSCFLGQRLSFVCVRVRFGFLGRLGPGRADFWICGSSGETWDKCGGGLLVAFFIFGFRCTWVWFVPAFLGDVCRLPVFGDRFGLFWRDGSRWAPVQFSVRSLGLMVVHFGVLVCGLLLLFEATSVLCRSG